MNDVDAVITSLELQLETPSSPFGSYINFRYIDTYPYLQKTQEMVNEIRNRTDVFIVNYEYTYSGIDEDTNLNGLEFTKN
jgi:hypothetical protein